MTEIDRVTKFDAYLDWFIANLLWYWTLVIEQNRDNVREIKFFPEPYKAIKILYKMRDDFLRKHNSLF
jgi:hypothetical protein